MVRGNVCRIGYIESIDQFNHNVLMIYPDTSVHYESKYSEENMLVRELGKFHIRKGLRQDDIHIMFNVIGENKITDVPDKLLPGNASFATKTFIIQRGEKKYIYEYILGDIVGRPLSLLYAGVTKIIREINMFPLSTLSVTMETLNKDISVGRTLEIFVTYSNRGSEPVVFLNPRHKEFYNNGEMLINFWRTYENDSGENDEELEFSVNASGYEHKLALHEVISSDRECLQVPPSADLKIFFPVKVPKCPIGNYTAELVFNTHFSKEKDDGMVDGEFHSDGVHLFVRKIT